MKAAELPAERSPCQCCGSLAPGWRPRYSDLQLYECSECNSFSYLPSESFDQKSLYTYSYFAGDEYEDYVGHSAVHEINARNKWRILKPYLMDPIRLLEVGCAYGFFVNYALQQGVETAYGLDVATSAIQYATENFGAHFGTALEGSVEGARFNCIVAWDVWEHLESPLDEFTVYVKSLPPGGIIAIGTIDSSSLVARIRGKRWRQIHPPTHIHYPTWNGLEEGLKSLGLEVLEHRHVAHYRALETYLSALGIKTSFSRSRLGERFSKFPIPLDLKDEQVIVCRLPTVSSARLR